MRDAITRNIIVFKASTERQRAISLTRRLLCGPSRDVISFSSGMNGKHRARAHTHDSETRKVGCRHSQNVVAVFRAAHQSCRAQAPPSPFASQQKRLYSMVIFLLRPHCNSVHSESVVSATRLHLFFGATFSICCGPQRNLYFEIAIGPGIASANAKCRCGVVWCVCAVNARTQHRI